MDVTRGCGRVVLRRGSSFGGEEGELAADHESCDGGRKGNTLGMKEEMRDLMGW